MYKILRNKSDYLKKDVVNFTQELVRTPSTSLKEEKAAKLIEKQMQKLEYDKVFCDEAGNVIGVMFGREGEPTVLLNSHIDTVSFEPEENAKNSLCSGKIENGKLYGLGASDCKGGLSAQLYAGYLLKQSLLPMRGNLVVAATVAEENGRSVGVRALLGKTLPELGLKPAFAILGEPTGLGLYYGHEGWMVVEIRVKGTDLFHVDDAAKAIYKDFGIFDEESRPSGSRDSVTYQPGFQDAGGVHLASIKVGQRLRFGEDVNELLGKIKHNAAQAAQTNGGLAIDVAVCEENQKLYNGKTTWVRHVTNAWSTDPFHPLMERSRQALSAAGCQVKPGKWKLAQIGMGTAGSVLVQEFQVPAIGYGPGMEAMAHKRDEYVEIDKITEAVYGTAAIVHSLIGIPVYGWTSDEEI